MIGFISRVAIGCNANVGRILFQIFKFELWINYGFASVALGRVLSVIEGVKFAGG